MELFSVDSSSRSGGITIVLIVYMAVAIAVSVAVAVAIAVAAVAAVVALSSSSSGRSSSSSSNSSSSSSGSNSGRSSSSSSSSRESISSTSKSRSSSSRSVTLGGAPNKTRSQNTLLQPGACAYPSSISVVGRRAQPAQHSHSSSFSTLCYYNLPLVHFFEGIQSYGRGGYGLGVAFIVSDCTFLTYAAPEIQGPFSTRLKPILPPPTEISLQILQNPRNQPTRTS